MTPCIGVSMTRPIFTQLQAQAWKVLGPRNVYQPIDEKLARKLPKYDFPEAMVHCTPGTLSYMGKLVETIGEEEIIKTVGQKTVVVTKPKYFFGARARYSEAI